MTMLPAQHWLDAARPYADRLAAVLGTWTGHAEAILAEAMQAAAESQWSEAVRDAVRRMEDDRK